MGTTSIWLVTLFILLGLVIILIGLFKKVFLADNLAILVESGFANHHSLEFFGSWLTSLCFTFQIYFDFSGYIDMAMGIGLLFNIIVFLIANKINKSQTIKDTLTNVENIENLVN